MLTNTINIASAPNVDNTLDTIPSIIQSQRDYFNSNITKDIDFRIAQLKKLKKAILKHEAALFEALQLDLHKSAFESYGTEIGLVLNDIDDSIKHVRKWSRPKRVATPLLHFKASSKIYSDPYGVALVIAPWNYPFQLLMIPVIGAMVAGNCVSVKPSELAPHTSKVVSKLLRETFESHYIAVFEGGVPVSQKLLAEKFDYIFFTGSTKVGKIVYQAAAKHLTPVTLELGGKSPCIVDSDVDVKLSAKRIMWGKLLNAGQTCIAPDYILVQEDVKEALIQALGNAITSLYGKNPAESPDYCRIINHRHLQRLEKMLHAGNIRVGGTINVADKYLAPTIIDNVSKTAPVMQEEIFGPILPVLTYRNIEEAIQYIKKNPKPLALYLFSKNQTHINKVLHETSSGGACVNDTVSHFANSTMPFGGVGESGIGGYHGKFTFDTFSHQKSVMDRATWFDAPLRYAPYKLSVGLLKNLLSKVM